MMTKFDKYILNRILKENLLGQIVVAPFINTGPKAYLLVDKTLMVYDKNANEEYEYVIK
jgi:hypothetical protein